MTFDNYSRLYAIGFNFLGVPRELSEKYGSFVDCWAIEDGYFDLLNGNTKHFEGYLAHGASYQYIQPDDDDLGNEGWERANAMDSVA